MSANVFIEPLVSRDQELNKKAYQRAVSKKSISGDRAFDWSYVTINQSENISPNQIILEKISRKGIVRMQNEINNQFRTITQ
jgi:hypothetical protein